MRAVHCCHCEEACGAPSDTAVIARRPQADVAIRPLAVSLRGAKRRGNLKAATGGKFQLNDTSLRLPRPLWGLAMTPVFSLVIARRRSRRGNLKAAMDGKFQVNDTSLRLPRPLWGLAMTDVVDGLRLGFNFPMSLRGAKRRGNLMAATGGKFQLNDISPRLPRPLWGLAMTDVVWHCWGQNLNIRPLRGRLPSQLSIPSSPFRQHSPSGFGYHE